jgi:hypothetical protein
MNLTTSDCFTTIETDTFIILCFVLLCYFVYLVCYYWLIKAALVIFCEKVYSLFPIDIQQQYPIRPVINFLFALCIGVRALSLSINIISHIIEEEMQ